MKVSINDLNAEGFSREYINVFTNRFRGYHYRKRLLIPKETYEKMLEFKPKIEKAKMIYNELPYFTSISNQGREMVKIAIRKAFSEFLQELGFTQKQISFILGYKDHATVNHLLRKEKHFLDYAIQNELTKELERKWYS